jgi:nicotinamide riboside kinase
MEKKSIIVNLFGGPGTGKSTGASYVFSKLKLLGIDAEYASEYAKDKVWEQNAAVFDCQFYITGKQAFRICRLVGKVDVIVTDSPILMGAIYGEDYLKPAISGEFNKYGNKNHNYFLCRKKTYNPNGRKQTEAQAKEIDGKIKTLLDENGVPYKTVDATEEGYNQIVLDIVNLIKNPQA